MLSRICVDTILGYFHNMAFQEGDSDVTACWIIQNVKVPL